MNNLRSLFEPVPRKFFSPSLFEPVPEKSSVFLLNRSQYELKPQVFTKISHLIPGNSNYYNVLCQIISCYSTSDGNTFLRVWDGTRNPKCTICIPQEDRQIVYGDEAKEKRVAADYKLCEVAAYDGHGDVAANLQSGDYVALINVHFYNPNSRFVSSLAMHGGEGKIKTENGESISAGREIIKITPEVTKAGYDYIHDLITTRERKLPQI